MPKPDVRDSDRRQQFHRARQERGCSEAQQGPREAAEPWFCFHLLQHGQAHLRMKQGADREEVASIIMYGFKHIARLNADAVLFQMKHDARNRHNEETGGEHSVNNAFVAFHW